MPHALDGAEMASLSETNARPNASGVTSGEAPKTAPLESPTHTHSSRTRPASMAGFVCYTGYRLSALEFEVVSREKDGQSASRPEEVVTTRLLGLVAFDAFDAFKPARLAPPASRLADWPTGRLTSDFRLPTPRLRRDGWRVRGGRGCRGCGGRDTSRGREGRGSGRGEPGGWLRPGA